MKEEFKNYLGEMMSIKNQKKKARNVGNEGLYYTLSHQTRKLDLCLQVPSSVPKSQMQAHPVFVFNAGT